jgi:hypothetical protein
MAKYKETNIQGSSYVRAKRIVVDNSLFNTNPSIRFEEEKVINVENTQTLSGYDVCYEQFITDGDYQNINEEFVLIDSITGQPTETNAKYIDMYNMLYSLYLHIAKKRDDANIEKEQSESEF